MQTTDSAVIDRLQANVFSGHRLGRDEAHAVFTAILEGALNDAQIAGILVALKMRGEDEQEILGAAMALRGQMLSVAAPRDAIDTCGTGGDGLNTYNVSTTTAIVLAACGQPVAKHGNRSVSSKSGSSDVLSALGIALEQSVPNIETAFEKLGIAFLFAPAHHQAMRHVAPARAALKTRTMFNLLGPLANPAQVKFQLLGVYDQALCTPMARVLLGLGSKSAWVVHGHDGLDELSIAGPSHVTSLSNGALSDFEVCPEDAGLPRHSLETLRGGDAAHNAAALREVLNGAPGAYRDATLLNTAAALVVTGKAQDLKAGAQMAAAAIDSGKASQILQDWAAFTQSEAGKPAS